ncbi:DUF2158 domain-containing protein [Chelatococcus reniformis]|uniref:DUF2158 domain-containing protein n=1 Tax=Chelatococcus reniformis TaxID=1494448 RepID=A0A916UVH9_9HYPH|nr:DUF2158 domain-containing protein [Chelatococcus reniformis]GGC90498.1 hypothetical protein GCM10010994_55400 [Chelatococcus reniformis]
MSQKFQTGDLVRLRSGGPTMTIVQVIKSFGGGESDVRCNWFAEAKGEQKVSESVFPMAALEAASKPSDE